MVGRESRHNLTTVVAILAAAFGLVGYVVFGWRFGDSNGPLPFFLGIGVAVFAIGWTLYQRR
jgi:hydrogenase/urease accessory protein HupE